MQIPPRLWYRLTQIERTFVYSLISLLAALHTLRAALISPITSIWHSPPSIFIPAFTACFCFAILPTMPIHPLAIPTTFGAGLSASIMLHAIFK